MPVWAPEHRGQKGPAGRSGEAPSARLAAGPRPGWLSHIVYRLANRQILPKPDSSSHAWALPVQLFRHLFLLKCIYYAERNRDGAGAEALEAPLRASFGNNRVGENCAALTWPQPAPVPGARAHWTSAPGARRKGKEPQLAFRGWSCSLFVSSMGWGGLLSLSEPQYPPV